MTNGSAADAPLSKDSLFPPGSPGTPGYKGGWDNIEEKADEPELDATPDGAEDDEDKASADAHDEAEVEGDDEATDGSPGKLTAKEFAKQAGWALEEFYRDVLVQFNGADVSLSDALNEAQTLKQTHDALSRERDELREKLAQASSQGPVSMQDPELTELGIKLKWMQQALADPSWAQLPPEEANSQRLNLMSQIEATKAEIATKQTEVHGKWQEQAAKSREALSKQIRSKIPEWNNPVVLNADMQANLDFMAQYGYNGNDTSWCSDARLVQVVNDARKALAKAKKIEKGAKVVNKVSRKTLGAGARGGPEGPASLSDSKRKISEASGRENKQKARLTVPLG